MELVDEADQDHNGQIDFGEWEFMGRCPVLSARSFLLIDRALTYSTKNQESHSNGR